MHNALSSSSGIPNECSLSKLPSYARSMCLKGQVDKKHVLNIIHKSLLYGLSPPQSILLLHHITCMVAAVGWRVYITAYINVCISFK